jgi:primosomal protein N' (replication factor Y)
MNTIITVLLFIFQKAFKESPKKKIKVPDNFDDYKCYLKKNINFDDGQKKAIKLLDENIYFDKFSTTLLHGITGSGKTLIYFKKIQDCLEEGYQVLVLLPEIALTNQIKERFKEYFNNYPALWHSDVSEKNKQLIWKGIAKNQINLVLGARSSLFLPFKKLGLIIIDEEHDQSYKQEDQIIYNARDMSVLMASIKKFPVILVSATPSLETYNNTINKKFFYISLDKRYKDAQLPKVKFVDLKKNPPNKSKFISPSIIPELKNNLSKGDQILFFLNRRGYSTFVICSKCGYRFNCPHCSVSLIYHKETNKLICHYCDHEASMKRRCKDDADCQFSFYGLGVEKIYEEVKEIFPDKKIELFSSDFIHNDDSAKKTFENIQNGTINIIVGTQLISKGFHFPRLNSIVVVNSDTNFLGNDIRSSEKTYQLMNQLSGRAGREVKDSTVYFQTFEPENQTLKSICDKNILAFYENEINFRESSNLPPFTKLIAFIVSGKNKFDVDECARSLRNKIPRMKDSQLLGPVSASISLIKGKYRSRLLLKYPQEAFPQKILKDWLKTIKIKKNISLTVDVDPINFK